jgi:hypothetical protein
VTAVKRIPCLLAIGVTLAVLGTPAVAHAGDARPAPVAPASLAPVALPDLGGIFGEEDENEPDENEREEGGGGAQGEAAAQEDSGPSFLVVLLLVVLGLVAARFALFYLRLRRRIRREGWLAVLLPRRASARGWAEDRTDRRQTLRERQRRRRA